MADIVARAIALKAKALVESMGSSLKYKGAVEYYKDLPTNAKDGECYSVIYEGESGTELSGKEYVWGNYRGSYQWVELGSDKIRKIKIAGEYLPIVNEEVEIPAIEPETLPTKEVQKIPLSDIVLTKYVHNVKFTYDDVNFSLSYLTNDSSPYNTMYDLYNAIYAVFSSSSYMAYSHTITSTPDKHMALSALNMSSTAGSNLWNLWYFKSGTLTIVQNAEVTSYSDTVYPFKSWAGGI